MRGGRAAIGKQLAVRVGREEAHGWREAHDLTGNGSAVAGSREKKNALPPGHLGAVCQCACDACKARARIAFGPWARLRAYIDTARVLDCAAQSSVLPGKAETEGPRRV